jgi:pilus assembly protein Flp/PilA
MLLMLARNNRGATAIEYGLIVSLIALAAIAGMSTLGGGALGMWTHIGDEYVNATN